MSILLGISFFLGTPVQAAEAQPEEALQMYGEIVAIDEIMREPSLNSESTSAAQTDGMVCGVMFWMDGCPHCHEVLDSVLPPLQEQYGDRLDIHLIEVKSMEEVDRLYEIGEMYGISRDDVGVPFFIIGEHALLGSRQIPQQLPGLIKDYLAAGGVSCPNLPELADVTTAEIPAGEEATMTSDEDVAFSALPVVQLMLFWTPDCHACQLVVAGALPPIQDIYGGQLQIQYVDVITSEDVERLYQVAAAFGLAKEEVNLPMLIVGDHVLIGSEQILAELENLVEMYLAAGGVSLPDIAQFVDEAPTPADEQEDRPNGFGLAIAVLVGMIAALVYAAFVVYRAYNGESVPTQPGWLEYAMPILCLIGLGVAGYLTYVETRPVSAVCGPVGDCNTVQSSQFAWLLGVMPVGAVGMLGYLAILASWMWSRLRQDKLAEIAPLAIFGMTFFGVLFSIYLTYLEPFVIRAVCLWCLSSSVIITLLFLLGLIALTQTINIENEWLVRVLYGLPHAL